MSARAGQPIEILLVEDSPGDVELTIEALHEAKVRNHLNVVSNGETALAFLKRTGEYRDAPRPDLVLLDLNLPRRDGREVLKEMKADPSLAIIPVVILTTSRDDADILRAYQLHANCYITKPVRLQEFLDVVKAIDTFWLEIVALPPERV
jgi:two-component system, chemotaxis family, response regulator Rcp1